MSKIEYRLVEAHGFITARQSSWLPVPTKKELNSHLTAQEKGVPLRDHIPANLPFDATDIEWRIVP